MNLHPRRLLLPLLLAAALPLGAHAADASESEISREISAELAEARKEVRSELAAARAELETGNLELGDGMHFGKSGQRSRADASLPKAEITLRGDFLVDGKAVGAAETDATVSEPLDVIIPEKFAPAKNAADEIVVTLNGYKNGVRTPLN